MKLKTTLFGNVYQFKDVKEVLAKANELRSGDVLAGVAAASSQERVAAKQVLSEMTVADIRNNPVIAYEDDCVTRLIQDDVNETAYNLSLIHIYTSHKYARQTAKSEKRPLLHLSLIHI